jgi:hypothetical protein
MAKYTNEKLAWAALSNMFPDSYNPLGAIGNMISGAQTTPDVPTRGMLMDRANGTDTASRQKAVETAKPLTNLTVPNTDPDQAWYNIPGHIGNMFSGPSQPPPAATTRGMILDRERGTDTASRQAALSAAGTNMGGGAPIGVGAAAGTNFGGGTPNGNVSNLPPKLPAIGGKIPQLSGAKQAMDKQAIAFRANRLHILNTEIARYNPANLIKQAADYPTTRNKQACAYYLGLKKQAAIEKKAILGLINQGLKATWGLLKAPFGATARGHMADAGKAALRGVEIATKKAPIASLAGAGGLTLGAEHFGLPFLGDVADATKARYNDTEKGIGNFFHRLSRGYNATTADPTADFSSSGINKAKKVIESVTPKSINSAVTNSGIIPSKPSRYLRVEEGSIPAEYKSRSLPEINPQWRSGTRGRYYDY